MGTMALGGADERCARGSDIVVAQYVCMYQQCVFDASAQCSSSAAPVKPGEDVRENKMITGASAVEIAFRHLGIMCGVGCLKTRREWFCISDVSRPKAGRTKYI
jgi:hypothetical protein